MTRKKPVVLCVLDGWGESSPGQDNSISQANTPHWNNLVKTYPHNRLEASELHVGLPEGQMGNSEVGHMNLGAGRVVMQDLPKIDLAVKDGSLAAHPKLQDFIATLKSTKGACHLLGLMSPGGVHSHQSHLIFFINHLASQGIPVWVHGFLDGRDTPPSSAAEYLKDIEKHCPTVKFGTLGGRYYAMDRDKRWERVEAAYNAMVKAIGEQASRPLDAIQSAYERGQTDEFILPTVIEGYSGMQDGDGIIMANFRSDRARQILQALLLPNFSGFERNRVIKFATTLAMADYSTELTPLIPALFPKDDFPNMLGEVVAQAGLKQLRIAETEKYAHVTFFFNGGREQPFAGEDRILIPSPNVATYDLKPEMSAFKITDALVPAIENQTYDLIVVNYANTDMVGHTGNFEATRKAVETVDTCLGRLKAAIEKANGVMLITADHGNAEQMWDETTKSPHTAHTCNVVPVVLVNPPAGIQSITTGSLSDIAPTLLQLMELPQPKEMTGKSLLQSASGASYVA